MTTDAGDAILVERSLNFGVLRQRTRKERRGVMTRFAVAGELDSFLRLQVLDIFLVERLAKRVDETEARALKDPTECHAE